MRIVQLLSGEELPVVLDEEGVEPEEEGAVIVAPGHAGRGAVEHELGVPVHPGPGHQLNTHLAQEVIKMIS